MKKLILITIVWSLIMMISGENKRIEMFEKFKGGVPSILENEVIIPFELQRSHVIEIQTVIKDNSFTMIMDTGGMTMLEKSINDSLDFETIEIPEQNVGSLSCLQDWKKMRLPDLLYFSKHISDVLSLEISAHKNKKSSFTHISLPTLEYKESYSICHISVPL